MKALAPLVAILMAALFATAGCKVQTKPNVADAPRSPTQPVLLKENSPDKVGPRGAVTREAPAPHFIEPTPLPDLAKARLGHFGYRTDVLVFSNDGMATQFRSR